jgi:hypothetical protein
MSLSETSAILKALQSFGPVSSFLNPRYMPYLKSKSQTEFYITFKESEALDKARIANPLLVDLGHDAADPEEADPFNVRGLWDRKRVERKTFTCLVYSDIRERTTVEANPYHGPFRVDRLAVSFQDLLSQGAPSAEIADCARKRHLNETDRVRFEQEAQRQSFYGIGENGEVTGGLMDTWRENLGSKAEVW